MPEKQTNKQMDNVCALLIRYTFSKILNYRLASYTCLISACQVALARSAGLGCLKVVSQNQKCWSFKSGFLGFLLNAIDWEWVQLHIPCATSNILVLLMWKVYLYEYYNDARRKLMMLQQLFKKIPVLVFMLADLFNLKAVFDSLLNGVTCPWHWNGFKKNVDKYTDPCDTVKLCGLK